MILLIGDAASCYVASGGVTEGLVALFVVLLHGWVKVVIVQGLPGQETYMAATSSSQALIEGSVDLLSQIWAGTGKARNVYR